MITEEDFRDEVKGIWQLYMIGHRPRYINDITIRAGPEFPYPQWTCEPPGHVQGSWREPG